MMSPRQAAFRAAFRAQIAPAYNGLIHVALIYLIGGAALWYGAQQIHGATWAEVAGGAGDGACWPTCSSGSCTPR